MNLSETQIQAMLTAAEKIDEKIARLEDAQDKLGDLSAFKDQIESIGVKQKELADKLISLQRADGACLGGNGKTEQKTLGQLFVESQAFHDFSEGKTARATLSIDVAQLAAVTTPADSVQTHRLPGVKSAPTLPNSVEALFPHVATNSNLIEYLQEKSFTNAAAAVAEGAQKPESGFGFEKKEAPVRTIAHWVKITKQLAEDADAVAAFINLRMAYGVARAIEKQIIAGDGSSENLAGIFKEGNYTPHGFTTTKQGADFNGLDAIRRSAAVITMAGYNPSHVILHPLDYDDILGMKDKQGRYLFGDPSGAADSVVWGLQPCVSPEVTQGKFMVVDPLMGGTVYDRTGLELQAFPQDGDNVQKNLVTIRAEKRVAFSVDAVGCFVGGNLKIDAQ